jgi:hypothetical protein
MLDSHCPMRGKGRIYSILIPAIPAVLPSLYNLNMTGHQMAPPSAPPIIPPTPQWCSVLRFWSLKNQPSFLEFRPPSLPPYYSLCGRMRQGGRCAPEWEGGGWQGNSRLLGPGGRAGSLLLPLELQSRRFGLRATPLDPSSPQTSRQRRLPQPGRPRRLRPSPWALPAYTPDFSKWRYQSNTGVAPHTCTVSFLFPGLSVWKRFKSTAVRKGAKAH